MARYGYDYGARFQERGGMSRYPRGDFGYPPRGYPGGPFRGDWGRPEHPGNGWQGYPEGRGRGGPRYAIDFDRGFRGAHAGPSRGFADLSPQSDWRTGEPRGRESDADRVCAGDIMTRNPEAVTPDTPLQEVARRMRDLNVGIMPVVDDEIAATLQGVVTDRDITVRAAAEGMDMKKTLVSEVMTAQVGTVHETDHVRDVFTVMKRDRVRRVPVVDDDGRLVGIIAQADLAVDYAGLDIQREAEVEEVIERISEPGTARRPRRRAEANSGVRYSTQGPRYDGELGQRIRHGLSTLKREARELLQRDRR